MLDISGGGSFAGVSTWRFIGTSSDGVRWTMRNVTQSGTGPQLDELTWTGSAFVASGDHPQGASRRAWWSLDGATWADVQLPAQAVLSSWTRLVSVHNLAFAATGLSGQPEDVWVGVPMPP
jgi:hypothetical protein